MTTLFLVLVPVYIILMFALIYFIFERIKQNQKGYDDLYKCMVNSLIAQKKADYVTRKIDEMSDDFDRSLATLRDSLKTANPIPPTKPNNWDSIRESFKNPSKIEINERN